MAYHRTAWATGDAISAEKLNKIEAAIEALDGQDGTNLQAAKDYADAALAARVAGLEARLTALEGAHE